MSPVTVVRARRDILAAPPWVADIRIRKGELLMALRTDEGDEEAYWRIQPFPGTKKDWHPFLNGTPQGLGVREEALEVLADLSPPPPISAKKDLSDSSWAAANCAACVWFLERYGAVSALIEGLQEAARGRGES